MAYLDSTPLPGMQDWFAALAVGFLTVFAPVILAPILGTLTTQVGQMMSVLQSWVLQSLVALQGKAHYLE